MYIYIYTLPIINLLVNNLYFGRKKWTTERSRLCSGRMIQYSYYCRYNFSNIYVYIFTVRRFAYESVSSISIVSTWYRLSTRVYGCKISSMFFRANRRSCSNSSNYFHPYTDMHESCYKKTTLYSLTITILYSFTLIKRETHLKYSNYPERFSYVVIRKGWRDEDGNNVPIGLFYLWSNCLIHS